MPVRSTPPTTLENCDREPIHIPGSIQPHGALLCFEPGGRLTHLSRNASALLGREFSLGEPLSREMFPGDTQAKVFEAISAGLQRAGSASRSLQATLQGRIFDLVLHRQGDSLICEFERRRDDADISAFAELAFRSLNELRQSASIEELLEQAVNAVRDITGFHRVMAYRFAHDDSGEIIAEARGASLEPYLGRRYPASDIPAQARRLYTLNTLRLIADMGYQPVPILAASGQGEPLDLSHSVLRSVSPIHVEYLTNMGVRSSMSASIVVGGRLWGMIACHHMQPRQVAYPVRMAVDVMAQVIAATVQSITARRREGAVQAAAWVRTEVARAISTGENLAEVVRREADSLRSTLSCDALLLSMDGDAKLDEGVDRNWAQALSTWLADQEDSLVHVFQGDHLPAWPEDVPEAQRFCGLLALRFDGPRQGWLVGLRRERVLTIRWGGRPEKIIQHGPNGPRLTPRGSFEEWKETVRGMTSPWSSLQLEIASQLLDTLGRAYSDRVLETDAMRSQLWAMLGHDLRNPLQSINMANSGIERGINPEKLNSVIRNSTGRMNRLLSDILDMSRLQHGFELTMDLQPIDLSQLLRQLVEETTTAHPACSIRVDISDSILMQGDSGRLAQLFANLFSNARHHGNGSMALTAHIVGGQVLASVSNAGAPIAESIVPTLFDPFKRASMSNLKNRTGMGLGLYIASEVVKGHHGSIAYVPGEDIVTFEVRLPLSRAEKDLHVDR